MICKQPNSFVRVKRLMILFRATKDYNRSNQLLKRYASKLNCALYSGLINYQINNHEE